ncbi:MAG: hypothetical protein ACYC2T_05715 [Bacillota bacterium]
MNALAASRKLTNNCSKISLTIILALAMALLIMPFSLSGLEHFNLLSSNNENETSLKTTPWVISKDAIENNKQESLLRTTILSLILVSAPGTVFQPEHRWASRAISIQYFPDKRYLNWLYPILHQSRYIG